MGLPTIVDSLTITDEHRQTAKEIADTSHCDTDMGRDADDHKVDAMIGMLGEIVFEEMVAGTDDLSLEDSAETQYDYLLNGHKVEVKTRKTWNFSKPDLLVRTKFDLAARFYFQVDLSTTNGNDPKEDLSNVETAEIIGYVTRDEVEQYGETFNPKGKINDTLLVQRRHLDPMHQFHARI